MSPLPPQPISPLDGRYRGAVQALGEHLSEALAEILDLVDRSGIRYKFTPCGTCLEGEWDEVMDVVRRAVAAVEARAPRVSLVLKADIRPGVTDGLNSKVETVERFLSE